ncbi:MAG TPA: aromatic amino acid transport family protein [Chlamydiales bacterium]|nr:aromatic amino acid transport family protein [Chlamydiales bacterium]
MQTATIAKPFDFKFLSAVSIIVGTSIGAGMLGLPVETARGGFLPAICLFLLTWFISISSGLLFSEVLLTKPAGSNYISLGKNILGEKIKFAIFFFYILLFFSLIVAYTKGIGVLFSHDFALVSAPWHGSLLFILLFLPLMFFGTHLIGKVNGLLTFILLTSFILLISIGTQNISFTHFAPKNWSLSLFSIPLMISSFGFHGTLPSLIDYLDRDRKKIQKSIVLGCTITLLIYLVWEFFILGSIPLHGEISLTSAWMKDETAISPMSQLLKNPLIWNLAHIFSLTAIITSFFGVSIGLTDFLIDAFQISQNRNTRILLLSSVYLSALLLSMTELRVFYLSLNYGAGIAGTFLLIFLPALMAFKSNQIEEERLFLIARKKALPLIFLFSAISVVSCILSFFRYTE